MMSRYTNRILVVLMLVLFFGLLSAQEPVQETRLLVTTESNMYDPSGGLGSKLFAYTRYDPAFWRNKVYRVEDGEEALVFEPRYVTEEYIYDVQVSRDDSRIVFGVAGLTTSLPNYIYSVRPDGTQLTRIVGSRDGCGKFVWPGYGTNFCSSPSYPRLSPNGQRILFFNRVLEWDEKAQGNLRHVYLSMISVTGGSLLRLEEVKAGSQAAWNEDNASIYYHSIGNPLEGRWNEKWNGLLRRYDLKTGRSEQILEKPWEIVPTGGLVVSPADGSIYFVSVRGFARLDPETGSAEVIFKEQFDTFDLSPDGRRAVGLKEGDVTILNLEFTSSSPLLIEPGVVDELELGRIPAARKKWALERGYSTLGQLRSEDRKKNGVRSIRWLDNQRLWCVVEEGKSTDRRTKGRVGIVRLTN